MNKTDKVHKFLTEFSKLNEIEKLGALYIAGAKDEEITFKTDEPMDLVVLATNLFNQLDEIQQSNLMEILEVANGTKTTTEFNESSHKQDL